MEQVELQHAERVLSELADAELTQPKTLILLSSVGKGFLEENRGFWKGFQKKEGIWKGARATRHHTSTVPEAQWRHSGRVLDLTGERQCF